MRKAISILVGLVAIFASANSAVAAAPSPTWSAPTRIDGQILDVFCPSTSFCAAVGSDGMLTYDGSKWSAPINIDSAGNLTAVSCPSISFCMAVDDKGNMLTYAGGSWSAPVSFDSGHYASSIVCASPSLCVAGVNNLFENVMTYDGSSWSAPTQVASGGYFEAGSGSCPTVSFCMFVDSNGNAVTYDGSKWSGPTSIENSGYPAALSCASASFCVAVSRNGNAVTYNGNSWSAPVNVDSVWVTSVSCPATSFCAAVDNNGNATIYNGSSWSAPTSVEGYSLFSVSCASASFCVAGGEAGSAVTYSISAPSTTTVTVPDYKVVQYIQDFRTSPETLEKCGPDLMGTLGIALGDAFNLCNVIQDSHNPDPPATVVGAAWTNFINSDEYRGFIHLPATTVGCTNGTMTSYAVHPGEFEWSPGYTPSPIIRKPYFAADHYDGPSLLSSPWGSQYDASAPTITKSGNALFVSYLADSRVAGPGRLGALLVTGYDAPFIWTHIVEEVTCRGYSTLIYTSAFPAVVMYANGQEFQHVNQDPRLGQFILSGGPGGIAGINPGPIHKQGEGYFYPGCNVTGDPIGATSYPIADFVPGPTSPSTCGVQPFVIQAFGGGGYVAGSATAIARSGTLTIRITSDHAGVAKAWLVTPSTGSVARAKRRGKAKRNSGMVAIGQVRLRHPGKAVVRLRLTPLGLRLLRHGHALRTQLHGALFAPGVVEPLRIRSVKVIPGRSGRRHP